MESTLTLDTWNAARAPQAVGGYRPDFVMGLVASSALRNQPPG